MHSAPVGTDQISFFFLIVSRNFLPAGIAFCSLAGALIVPNKLPSAAAKNSNGLPRKLAQKDRHNFFRQRRLRASSLA
jgi:hypothetical protein